MYRQGLIKYRLNIGWILLRLKNENQYLIDI